MHDEMAAADITTDCPCVPCESEHPLFILYTSGSTGKPKGVLHTTAGYLLYVHDTSKYTFNLHDDDVHFCAADVGWVTGHSYIVYGPLANGVTSVVFESIPTYPEPDRYWAGHRQDQADDRSTRRRPSFAASWAWARSGREKHPMESLRVIGTVGEPIDPNSWKWYYENVGKDRIPMVDTWWQTETGGHMITPLPGGTPLKPASANRPFFGIKTQVLKDDGTPGGRGEQGHLVSAPLGRPCCAAPGAIPTGTRFKEVYFSMFKNKFYTGDGCVIDEDGDHWLKGRVDDVLNVSGHRIGTAEVESALVGHPDVAEAAVVGYPHHIKGTGIYAYVTLNAGVEASDQLEKELERQCARSSAPSRSRTRSSSLPACPRPAPARSCAASCARSPRASWMPWAIRRRWPTRPSWRT